MFNRNQGALGIVVLVEIFIYGGTHLVAEAEGKKIADIYWNTTNPIFYFDNRYHIFDVRLMDRIDIICPTYKKDYPDEKIEYSSIYLVDRPSYESCTLDVKNSKLIGICLSPYSHQLITIMFREFTPSPNALEFRANRTYYVISTSDGSKNGLKNDKGGLCRDYNMRLQFAVRPRCRPKDAIVPSPRYDPALRTEQENSEEFDDCDERPTESERRPPTWTEDVQPPPFPRQPYPWPNRPPGAKMPYGPRRSSGARSIALNGTICLSILLFVTRWTLS